MKKVLAFLLVFTCIFASGCSSSGKTQKSDQINVYTTVYPIKFFTEQIGGKHVSVTSLYPAGGDEHTFEPTQKDIISIADADLFLYIGLELEPFVPKAKETLQKEKVKFIALGEQLTLPDITDDDGDAPSNQTKNPHIWLDPIYSIDMAEKIKNELSTKLPANKDEFEKNFQSVKEKLVALNQSFIVATSSSPKKEFLVTHAAFNYWEVRYHVKQLHIEGMSTTEEPSQKQIKDLIETVKNDKLEYILVEQNINKKFAETIQKETGTQLLPIQNLATMTQDDIDKHKDYFSIMNDNIASLKKALGSE